MLSEQLVDQGFGTRESLTFAEASRELSVVIRNGVGRHWGRSVDPKAVVVLVDTFDR